MEYKYMTDWFIIPMVMMTVGTNVYTIAWFLTTITYSVSSQWLYVSLPTQHPKPVIGSLPLSASLLVIGENTQGSSRGSRFYITVGLEYSLVSTVIITYRIINLEITSLRLRSWPWTYTDQTGLWNHDTVCSLLVFFQPKSYIAGSHQGPVSI